MSVSVTPVTNTQTFGTWLARTNQIASIMSANVVTTANSTVGGFTSGNGTVNGIFGSTTLFASDGLRGGNVGTSNTLLVVSNVAFRYISANVVTISGNASSTNVNVISDSFTVNTVANSSFVVSNYNISSSTNTNISGSGLFASVTTATIQGNTILKANSSHNMFAVRGDSLSITANATTTTFTGTSFTTNANTTLNGLVETTGNTTVSARLTVTGNATFSNSTVTVGNASFSNTVLVTGGATFSNTVAVTGNVSLSNTLLVTGNVNLSNTLTVTGTATFSGQANVVGALGVNGAVSISNSATVSGLFTGSGGATITGTTNTSVALNVGANATITTAGLRVTDSSLNTNTIVTSASMFIGNTVSNSVINSTSISTSGILSVSGNASVSGNLTITGATSLSNSLSVTGNVALSNTLAVTGNVVFSNTLLATGNATFSNAVAVTGNVIFSNTLVVTGNVNFSNTLDVVGSLFVNSSITTPSAINAASANISGNVVISGSLTVSGNQTIVGTTLYSTDLIPTSNGIGLGNTSARWALWATTGTFTSGFTVGTGNTNFNSGVLFVDGTNSRVGVSNNNPTNKFVVSGGNVQITTVGGGIVFPDSTFLNTASFVSGSDTQVQFNNSGSLGASGGFTFNRTTNNVTVSNTINVARVTSNTLNLNSTSHSVTANYAFSSTSEAAVDSFAVSTFRSADYTIQLSDTATNSFAIAKILVVHNGTEPYSTQFGSISSNNLNNMCVFRATISGGNVNLLGTPTTATVTAKIHKVLLTV